MYTFYLGYIAIMLFALAMLLMLAYYAGRRGRIIFTLFLLAGAEWAIVTLAGILGTTQAWFDLWWRFRFIGSGTVAPLFLLFVLDYNGQYKLLTRQRMAALFIIPFITQIIVWTNDSHHLMWQELDVQREENIFLLISTIRYGAWYWIFSTYNYIAILTGIGLLIRQAMRTFPPYRNQAILMVVGVLISLIASLIAVFSLIPGPMPTTQPIGFAISGIIFYWALYRYQLLNLMPIARDAVFESLTDAVFVLDTENRMIDLNPMGLSLLGNKAIDVIGQPARQVFAKWTKFVDQYQDIYDTHSEFVTEDAIPRYYDLQISPLHGRQNKLAGRLIVLHDITERKKMETEQTQLIAELDAYAHTVAHDLKNPLSSVIGGTEFIEYMHWDKVSEDVQNQVKMIERNSRTMLAIINELLLLGQIRYNDSLELTPIDMSALIQRVQERFTQQITDSQAKITVPETWGSIQSYAPWLEEVWANYLSNALKYGGSPPQIELGMTPQSNMVRFWIKDNGHGLTQDEQAKIFVKFSRLETQRAEGHGLGLSIVKRIVQKLGGTVGVESVVGQGSTFYFELPHAVGE